MERFLVKNKLRKVFPFIITIILWHLSDPLFNPFGAISLVPIYYYMYIRRQSYWFVFGLFMSFMLDFNAGTLFLFSSAFIIINAINQMYGIIEKDAGLKIRGFNTFLMVSIILFFIFSVIQFGDIFSNFLSASWLYLWIAISYFPVTSVLGWVSRDR